eukprot:scaffold25595_cov112-Isochrysis_galbana.AAC.1
MPGAWAFVGTQDRAKVPVAPCLQPEGWRRGPAAARSPPRRQSCGTAAHQAWPPARAPGGQPPPPRPPLRCRPPGRQNSRRAAPRRSGMSRQTPPMTNGQPSPPTRSARPRRTVPLRIDRAVHRAALSPLAATRSEGAQAPGSQGRRRRAAEPPPLHKRAPAPSVSAPDAPLRAAAWRLRPQPQPTRVPTPPQPPRAEPPPPQTRALLRRPRAPLLLPPRPPPPPWQSAPRRPLHAASLPRQR